MSVNEKSSARIVCSFALVTIVCACAAIGHAQDAGPESGSTPEKAVMAKVTPVRVPSPTSVVPSPVPSPKRKKADQEDSGFMGMPMSEKEEAPEKQKTQTDISDDMDRFAATWAKYMGVESPYRPIILPILTLLLLFTLKRYLSRVMREKVLDNAFEPANARSFMKVWNGIWKFMIAILVLIAMSGSFRVLGLTTGFLGMMLGWSLQQPVTGIAAWLMIIFKKPFKIGDRVVIAGITGDVTQITLTHVILNQVGGSISGEEKSGRGILIPNAILFQNVIINYTLEQEYMLDEVPVRLTFASDWEKAKEILISAATECTKEIIEKTGSDPFIRAEFLEWGVLARLRYQTIPTKRQEISTEIIEVLLREFKKEYPTIRFASPMTIVRHRPDEATQEESPED